MILIRILYLVLFCTFCISLDIQCASTQDQNTVAGRDEQPFFKRVSFTLFKQSALFCLKFFWYSLRDVWNNYGPAPVSRLVRIINTDIDKFKQGIDIQQQDIEALFKEQEETIATINNKELEHDRTLEGIIKRQNSFVRKHTDDIARLPHAVQRTIQPRITRLQQYYATIQSGLKTICIQQENMLKNYSTSRTQTIEGMQDIDHRLNTLIEQQKLLAQQTQENKERLDLLHQTQKRNRSLAYALDT